MPKLMNNLVNKDYLLVSVQDLDNQVELTDIFYKEKNLNFIQRKSIKEKNDYIYPNNFSYQLDISTFLIINKKLKMA